MKNYKIGEFSKINQVTVKTLRYYEEEGLLLPILVDEWTGYRYYTLEQSEILAKIQYLKSLGLSIKEIKLFTIQGFSQEFISAKKQQALEDIARLKKIINELDKFDKLPQGEFIMEQIFIKALPKVIVASYRTIIKDYSELNNIFPNIMYPAMVKRECVCIEPEYCFNIYHDGEYKENNIDVETCQAVSEIKEDVDNVKFKVVEGVEMAVCILHKGSYQTLGKSYAKAFEYIEKNAYQTIENPRESYIDGIWNKEDPNEWLTEIQIPVKRN